MKKKKIIVLSVCLVIIALLLAGIFLIPAAETGESINDAMRDEVLHETNKISLFGLKVNPGLISAFTVTGVLFVFSLIVRIFVIPKFTIVPKKFQLVLETAVGTFDDMAKSSSPSRNKFLGAYIFTAAAYIFIGTLFELLGLQAVTTLGRSVAGIGINVNQRVFDPALPNPVSMALAAGRTFDREEVLERFRTHCAARYALLERGDADTLQRDYRARMYRLGTPHPYRLPDGSALEVNHVDEGQPTEFWYAEVEYPTVEAALAWQPESCGLGDYLKDEVTNQPGQSMGEYWVETRG